MPAKHGRNVSLTTEHAAFVDGLVESGRFGTASEVVREGLRLLEREEHRRLLDKWLLEGLTVEEAKRLPPDLLERARARIRQKIKEGLDSLERGDFVDGEAFMAEMEAKLQARIRQRSPRKRKA